MNEEAITTVTILRHIRLVQKYLTRLAHKLEERAIEHDTSKFAEDEFSGFVEINRIAREHPYGSPEYKASIANNNAVALHYSRNSHHPEFYENGINQMSLLDLIEMVIDWKAASETYGQASFAESVDKSIDRFKPNAYLEYVIRLIARELMND